MSPPLLLWHQDLAPEQLEENPIIFGDFIKVGASKDDRLYEEYSDQKKLRNALSEVGVSKGVSILCKSMNKTHTHTPSTKQGYVILMYIRPVVHHPSNIDCPYVCVHVCSCIHTYVCIYVNPFCTSFVVLSFMNSEVVSEHNT